MCRRHPEATRRQAQGTERVSRRHSGPPKRHAWRNPGPAKKHAGDTQGVTSEMTESPKPQERFSCQLRTHFGLRFGLHFCADSMVFDDFLNEAFCMRSEVTPSGSANTKRRFGLRLEVGLHGKYQVQLKVEAFGHHS